MITIVTDKYKRNSYIKLKFQEDDVLLDFIGNIEKYDITYTSDEKDINVILVTLVNFIQFASVESKYWGQIEKNPKITFLGYCYFDSIGNERPLELNFDLSSFQAFDDLIILKLNDFESLTVRIEDKLCGKASKLIFTHCLPIRGGNNTYSNITEDIDFHNCMNYYSGDKNDSLIRGCLDFSKLDLML